MRLFNGVANKSTRLGLVPVLAEVVAVVEGFDLLVEERKHANGTRGLRKTIDAGFAALTGWTKITVGGVDWSKSSSSQASLGVEVQVSGRSDMLAVDVLHLTHQIKTGSMDVGVIVVPDDELSYYLTDRTPNFATALKHVTSQAADQPIQIIAFKHNGVGPALDKMRTNLGRLPLL